MKKLCSIILLLLLLVSTWSCKSKGGHYTYNSKDGDPFPHLREIVSEDTEAHLYVFDSETQVFDKRLKELDESHPQYNAEDCESEMTLVAVTSVDNSEMKYAIIYGYCPEPEFHIYASDDPSKYYGSICATRMYLPGNGNLYASGHVNSNFPVKRKFTIHENGIQTVKQAYYHVGLKTKTLKPLTLYETKSLKNVVASLPVDYKIEVVLAESYDEPQGSYLVKTNFGLMGWTKIEARQYQSVQVEGIFWGGD